MLPLSIKLYISKSETQEAERKHTLAITSSAWGRLCTLPISLAHTGSKELPSLPGHDDTSYVSGTILWSTGGDNDSGVNDTLDKLCRISSILADRGSG